MSAAHGQPYPGAAQRRTVITLSREERAGEKVK
jgi:hypothetical protein